MAKRILKQPLITSEYLQASRSIVIGHSGGDYASANGIVFSDGTIQTTAGIATASVGSFVTTSSFNSFTSSINSFTSSYNTGSFTGSFTGSLSGTATGLSIDIVRIATSSVTASVTSTQFSVISGSSTELTVTGTGVTIGSALTDIHTVTGSLNITGSLSATSITAVPRGYYYFMTQSAQSVSAATGSEQSLTSITIPANTIQVGDRLEIGFHWATPSNTAVKSLRVRLNGATPTTGTILNFGASLAASVVGWFSHVLYRQSTSTLINGSTFYYGAVTTAAQIQNSASLDITQANTFYFNGVRNGASDTITLLDCYVKILR